MQFVKAQDLKVGDQLIIGDTSHRADEVTVGQSRVAIRSATYLPGPLTYSVGAEVLIEDRVPAVKPEPTPPPQWHVRYHWLNGMVTATLMHSNTPMRRVSWDHRTEHEALNDLLQLWGNEIKDNDIGRTCLAAGCNTPRLFCNRHATLLT